MKQRKQMRTLSRMRTMRMVREEVIERRKKRGQADQCLRQHIPRQQQPHSPFLALSVRLP